jgi:acetyl-CoA carboxylase biotin carboxyl carrier protein
MTLEKKPPPKSTQSSSEVPEQTIRKLSDLLKTTDLAEIEITTDKMTIRVRAKEAPHQAHMIMPAFSSPPPTPGPSMAAGKKQGEAQSDLHIIRSPFVGTFYRSSSPSSAAYVEQGQSTTKGQVLCIVEAMKLMNEIEADTSGVIEKIFVENATAVEFNTPLFGLRK